MNLNYVEENSQLLYEFIKRRFVRAWRNPEITTLQNFQSIEFIFEYKCDLSCLYCYVNRYGNELYPQEIRDPDTMLQNLDTVLDWLHENNAVPKKIEIFSGEPLIQDTVRKGIRRIQDSFAGQKTTIVIPTNYTFILSDSLTKKVEAILERGKSTVPVFLSASFDGKYCEGNRPFRYTVESGNLSPGRIYEWKYKKDSPPDPRNDEYYDKCFAFTKKWKFGFHPMVYSKRIEHWKENFLWFQRMFEKHGLPWHGIYLLEVRNVEWSPRQILEYNKFIDFLIRWTFNKCNSNPERFLNFLRKRRGFNILGSPLSTVGRGIGCSIQGTLFVRLGDLALVPCHRNSYDQFLYGKFKTIGGPLEVNGYTRADGTVVEPYIRNQQSRITGIESKNPELWIGILSARSDCFPYCERCVIRDLCNQGCLGSQLETTGDLFTPIPTVCSLYHNKMVTMMNTYKNIGLWTHIRGYINENKRRSFKALEELSGR